MSSLQGKLVKIAPPYRRRVELPYCCVPAVLQMVFERRGMTTPEQEKIGYELGLIVPEEMAHRFHRVRTDSKPPSGGWGTQTGLEEFSIGQYFERHHLPLRIVEYPASEIPDLETFLAFLAHHLKQGDDVVACFDQQHLLGTGDTEHVSLVQAVGRGFVALVDPAEDSPGLYHVQATQLLEALRARRTGRFGLWVISSGSGSGDFR
jgi:hypothetical protein